ncbi:hypothetical protein IW262DRAFT_1381183 [Armillaria fumosa]|nr:hypothetical protein IW262DRAFT_1381183 [Armillaria fumosa]
MPRPRPRTRRERDGRDPHLQKAELKNSYNSTAREEPLRGDETSILNGVLKLNPRNGKNITTSMKMWTVAPTRRPVCALMVDTTKRGHAQLRDTFGYEMIDAILTNRYSFPMHETGNPLAFMVCCYFKSFLPTTPQRSFPLFTFPEASFDDPALNYLCTVSLMNQEC